MTVKHLLRTGLLALAAAAVVGGVAWAREHGPMHHGMWKGKIAEHVDDALDAAKANEGQRTAIHAALDHVFATVEDGQKDHRADMEKGIALFESERIDPAQLQAMRGEREAQVQKTGDAIVQAVSDAHDALTAEQRREIVAWVRDHKPGEHAMHGHGGRGAAFMKLMVNGKINEALDAARATQPQRVAIEAARDHVFAAFESMHNEDPSARIGKVLDLFAADKLDMAKVNELRTEHVAKMRLVGDAIEQAIRDAHDALTAPQRKAVGDFIRTSAANWHHGGHGDAPEAVTNH